MPVNQPSVTVSANQAGLQALIAWEYDSGITSQQEASFQTAFFNAIRSWAPTAGIREGITPGVTKNLAVRFTAYPSPVVTTYFLTAIMTARVTRLVIDLEVTDVQPWNGH